MPVPAVADTNFFDGDNGDLLAANVLFSRGCPFSCRFCANINLGPTRYRNSNLITEEIDYLKKEYGIEALVLRDDNGIPFNKKVATSFLEAIGNSNVAWRGQSRANGITEEQVKLAAQSGCTDIAIGMESVSPLTLKIIEKKIDVDLARIYLKTLRHYNINAKLLLILGLPGESDNIVQEMLDFIDETEPKSVQVSLFTPFPGSDMTDNHQKYGIKTVSSNFEDFHITQQRFDADEQLKIFYEYDEVTPWGKGKKQDQILAEYEQIQSILRERQLIF